jgi:hypothetical protein
VGGLLFNGRVPRSQRIVILVLSLAFFALSAAAFVRGFPWYVAALWAGSGVVMLLLFRKTGPRTAGSTSGSAAASTRARRSGNPAVRAAQQDRDSAPPSSSQ